MALSDPIADMLTILRNASNARKATAEVKASRLTEAILAIMKRERYIANYKRIEDKKQGILRVYLKYGKAKNPAVLGIRRISKPSLRIYRTKDKLPTVCGGLGIAIVSTSQGLLTETEAREKAVGGEILCYVW